MLHAAVGELSGSNPSRAVLSEIDIEGAVRCDTVRSQPLISNLVGNALAHGGTLEVCSSAEAGACFTARIPGA
ncbi:hypothetical protein [Paraburkholderia sp. BCC1885]|uniref:hypothetical protein n=1 Tax=Paraburkholderia sp. BCC1885 TaxID=2562669 RepID=UPI001642583D|nr:hypothetical protein [Paraburkholderia sp. BCC1885]